MFRRRRDADDDTTAETPAPGDDLDTRDDGAEDLAGAGDDTATPAAAGYSRAAGPLDSTEAKDELPRVDFGALRVPMVEGTEIRVEIEEETGVVQTINVVTDGSAMQLDVYAAPRKAGIWDEVRTSIAAGITSSGGMAGEQPGPLGPEVRAKVPFDDGKHKGFQPARFLGVDGPRWFVRGVLTGAAAEDDGAAALLVDVLRGCVVVRGGEARAPHEPLPLELPQDARPAGREADGGPEGDGGPDLNPFERGPEITEIR